MNILNFPNRTADFIMIPVEYGTKPSAVTAEKNCLLSTKSSAFLSTFSSLASSCHGFPSSLHMPNLFLSL